MNEVVRVIYLRIEYHFDCVASENRLSLSCAPSFPTFVAPQFISYIYAPFLTQWYNKHTILNPTAKPKQQIFDSTGRTNHKAKHTYQVLAQNRVFAKRDRNGRPHRSRRQRCQRQRRRHCYRHRSHLGRTDWTKRDKSTLCRRHFPTKVNDVSIVAVSFPVQLNSPDGFRPRRLRAEVSNVAYVSVIHRPFEGNRFATMIDCLDKREIKNVKLGLASAVEFI